jgi:DNA replication protein DnaC
MRVDLKTKKAIMMNEKRNLKLRRKRIMNMTKTLIINKCEFCGKTLKDRTIPIKIGDEVHDLRIGIERCDCKEAQSYWEKVEQQNKARRLLIAERERQNRQNRLLDFSRMNPRVRGYNFLNYKVTDTNRKAFMKAKEYAKDIVNGKNNSLFITGNVGAGKTHLAASIANYLIENNQRVIFGTLINLLGEIKDSYKSNSETEGIIIDKYSRVPLLIIDDLGKEKPSEWVLEKLFTIINNRYERNLPVVITTNYNREQLTERLADGTNYIIAESIISRLYEMCSGISINGKDKRKELV